MPYRGDLHSLVINPEDRSKGNFLHIDGGTYTIVINEHKTAPQWGPKKDVLDADVCELVRRFMEFNGLRDGDYLLGERPHSEWINKFLTTVGQEGLPRSHAPAPSHLGDHVREQSDHTVRGRCNHRRRVR